MPCNTPMLFLVFNRPGQTEVVFDQIRKAAPPVLFVSADGPRGFVDQDAKKCADVRAIIDKVDWPCEVQLKYRDNNIGCRLAVSDAITWFFNYVEEGIILEDDCLPLPGFFQFCEEMLAQYRNDANVMHVSGCNLQQGKKRGEANYYFSKYPHIGGWATWRRAWQTYDLDMKAFAAVQDKSALAKRFFQSRAESNYFIQLFQRVAEGEVDNWDYQWTFAIWNHDGLAITPNINLISNLTLKANGTVSIPNAIQSTLALEWLKDFSHPSITEANRLADNFIWNTLYANSATALVKSKVKSILRSIVK